MVSSKIKYKVLKNDLISPYLEHPYELGKWYHEPNLIQARNLKWFGRNDDDKSENFVQKSLAYVLVVKIYF